MVLEILASRVLKRTPLRLFHLPEKQSNKFLNVIFSAFQVRNSTNYASNKINEIIDFAEVSKYLNFIASGNADKNHLRGRFEQLCSLIQNKKDLEKEIKNLEDMSSEGDKELEKLIETEKKEVFQSIESINDEIISCIMPCDDENDNRNVELRILPGIGGEESKLFSEELYQMYINYGEFKNWEISGDSKSDGISIEGEDVFGHLRYEAGVHRVQRVPATEKSGRIHTSTCSVVVLPQPNPHEVNISESDLIIEKLRSSGPGGQNVNKRETCVRIKHIPTGIMVENQTARFQYENLKFAIQKLRTIIFNAEQEKINLERKSLKKQQAGTNDYADKIRTYNFPQSRVTDHRVGYSTQNLRGFLSGNKVLDDLIKSVRENSRRKELIHMIRNTLDSLEYKNFEKQQT